MKKLLFISVLCFLLSCAGTIPDMPNYQTSKGRECGVECQKDYSDCMDLEVRPDYLLMSPRKRACGQKLEQCYQLCWEQDK